MHPVADLQNGRAAATVKAGRADDDVVQQHSDHDVTPAFPFGGPLVDESDARVDAPRLPDDPWHPRTEVFEVVLNCRTERRRILGKPTTQRQPLGCHRLRQSVHPPIVTFPNGYLRVVSDLGTPNWLRGVLGVPESTVADSLARARPNWLSLVMRSACRRLPNRRRDDH